jgi:hypothetical protein
MKPGDVAGGGGVPRVGAPPAGSHPAAAIPCVPIVRSLLKYPIDSPEFEDALRCSGPDEREFVLEIIRQQKDCAIVERARIQRRMAELEHLYPELRRERSERR